jgi:hypothetical protein
MLSVVLAGHPKLKNDPRKVLDGRDRLQCAMIFELEGLGNEKKEILHGHDRQQAPRFLPVSI